VHDAIVADAPIAAARAALSRCAQELGEPFPDPADLIFLDTETTGLAGGTGTHVFLVGVGRFSADALHVRQFFMRHPGDERSLLSALAAEISRSGALVTYNGRSFDVPLLDARYTMHGRSFTRPDVHIDLLGATRAIWKHRLQSCSLGAIEQAILGVSRELDAPGWMIPQLYFDYLRSRRIELLEPVFAHNRSDIVSLARLTALVQAYEVGLEAPPDRIDRLGLALHRLRRYGDPRALAELGELWTELSVPSDLRLRGLRAYSTALKRQRRYAEAVAAWQRALGDPSRSIRLYATEELAKFLEHRERDHARAHELSRRGADGALLAGDDAAAESFARRVRRLERKLGVTTIAQPPVEES
jgi:uncharacterized protein YprB with RNaseH-like and TPR domain